MALRGAESEAERAALRAGPRWRAPEELAGAAWLTELVTRCPLGQGLAAWLRYNRDYRAADRVTFAQRVYEQLAPDERAQSLLPSR